MGPVLMPRPLARHLAAVGVSITAAVVAACSADTASARSHADPFAYCSAVGNVDVPDGRYTGPAMPPAVAEGLRRALGAAADAPIELFTRGASWRCMGGTPYACSVGANLPCRERADTSRAPAVAVTESAGSSRAPMWCPPT